MDRSRLNRKLLRLASANDHRFVQPALAAVFLLALVARVAVILALHNYYTIPGYESEEIAKSLLLGNGFSLRVFGPAQPTAYQYPLYPFFFFAHYFFFGRNFLPLELTQAVIGAGSCVLIAGLGRRLFDDATGLVAGGLSALYPVYVYWTARAQALTLEVFILLLLLTLLARAMDGDRLRDWALAGAALGLGVLSKTLYLVFTPAFLIWARSNTRWSWRKLLPRFGLMLLAAGAMVAPWTARNYLVFHRFILVSANGGYNLWIGNNPEATGGLFARGGEGMWTVIPAEMSARLARALDPDQDEIFRRAAREYIRERPGRFLALIPARLRSLWWFEPFMPSDFPLFREIAYLLLLAPALAGMVLSRRRWRELSILYLPALIMTAVYAAYYGSARFRYLIEFNLILFAAYAMTNWGRRMLIRGEEAR